MRTDGQSALSFDIRQNDGPIDCTWSMFVERARTPAENTLIHGSYKDKARIPRLPNPIYRWIFNSATVFIYPALRRRLFLVHLVTRLLPCSRFLRESLLSHTRETLGIRAWPIMRNDPTINGTAILYRDKNNMSIWNRWTHLVHLCKPNATRYSLTLSLPLSLSLLISILFPMCFC